MISIYKVKLSENDKKMLYVYKKIKINMFIFMVGSFIMIYKIILVILFSSFFFEIFYLVWYIIVDYEMIFVFNCMNNIVY